MKRLSSCDLPAVATRFNNHKHSLFFLGSVHGFSMSEMEVHLEEGAIYFLDEIDEPNLLLSVANVDVNQGTAQFQLCGEPRNAETLDRLINTRAGLKVRRLYSFVFPWEMSEINSLRRLGFQQEAVFREHIYLDGQFHDLLVWGSVGEGA